MRSKTVPLGVLLLSGFLDYAGIAIIYPLLAYLLFDPSFHFFSIETASGIRGLWLGVLIAIHPFFQFFFSPIFGSLSDLKGRKKLLKLSFWVGLVGYGFAIFGIYYQSIAFLAVYRMFSGIGCGNSSIVSAIIADISTPEKKTRYYGLVNMSFGAGFTLGPFISGILAQSVGPIAPFAAAFGLIALNLLLVHYLLPETNPVCLTGRIKWFTAVYQIKKAVQIPELRFIFLALLVFSFGWSFFTEFVPLFLIDRFDFSLSQIGFYYGYTGVIYALSAGFIIYPIVKFIGMQRTLFLSMLFSGLYLLLFLEIKSENSLWLYLPFSQFFLAFAYPTFAALISNQVSETHQGEIMGIYQSLIALALTIVPFCSGSFVGNHPTLTVSVSGVLMACASMMILLQGKTATAHMN